MPMQEFLASFGVEVDESGASRLQEILKENKTLADDLSKAFAAARSALKPLLSTTATEALNSLQTSGALNLRLTADASGVIAAASTALAAIKAAYSGTTLSLAARITTAGGDLSSISGSSGRSGSDLSGLSGSSGRSGGIASGASGIMASTGGRFTHRTRAEVAEDGQTEYIIPIQKEAIAVPLLRQLLSELSASARESVVGKNPSPAPELTDSARESIMGMGKPTSPAPELTDSARESIMGMGKPTSPAPENADTARENNKTKPPPPAAPLSESPKLSIASLRAVSVLSESPNASAAPAALSGAIAASLSAASLLSAAPALSGGAAPASVVQAPVNITVNTSGASPEAVGRSVYNLAERYLQRTLQ